MRWPASPSLPVEPRADRAAQRRPPRASRQSRTENPPPPQRPHPAAVAGFPLRFRGRREPRMSLTLFRATRYIFPSRNVASGSARPSSFLARIIQIEPAPEFAADLGQSAAFDETLAPVQGQGGFIGSLDAGDHHVPVQFDRPRNQRSQKCTRRAPPMKRGIDEHGIFDRVPVAGPGPEVAERSKADHLLRQLRRPAPDIRWSFGRQTSSAVR